MAAPPNEFKFDYLIQINSDKPHRGVAAVFISLLANIFWNRYNQKSMRSHPVPCTCHATHMQYCTCPRPHEHHIDAEQVPTPSRTVPKL